MSGQEFINFLDEIGFPNSNELDADSFDWMFDNQETKDFMQWLCQDLTTENLITPEEISRFEQLKSSGGLVLDNERLEEALMIERSKNSMFIDDHLYSDDPSKRIEAVKKQIEETESQIRSVKKRKNLLIKQRNILEEHTSSIIEKQAKLEKASKIAGSEYEREISNVKAADQSYDEAANSLLPALDNLMTHYKQFGNEHNHTSSSVMTPNLNLFLSQVSLDRLQKQDDEFLRELSNYAKHLFSTSSNVNMTEDTMKSEGCFTHFESSFLSNPIRKNLDCKSSAEVGDSENLVTRQQEELQMMQEIMSSYQIKFVKAVTKETENRALQNFLTLNMGDIKFSFIPEDPNLMREMHFDLEKEYKALTDDIRELLSDVISKQSKKIGNLEASNILLRNYESKCSSQKQLLENQTRIVEKLVAEKARKEFLVLALNLEMRDHKEISGVLKTAYNFINNNKMQSDSRTKILEEKLTMSRAQSPSMPILSKETFLHQLNSIITLPPPSSSSSSSVYASKLQLTAEDLLEKCRIVYQKSQSLNLNKKLFNNMAEEGAFILNKEITECLKLFPASCLKPSSLKSLQKADGFVEFGLAQLMLPRDVVVPMADLDDALQKLEKFVGEMVKDLEKKKGALKSDKFLAEERNLYINFFTNPELFRRQMARIKSRVGQQQTR